MVQTIQSILSQSHSNGPKEDVLSKLVGQFGTWQFIVFSSVFLVKLSSGWVQMAILFLTPSITFWCADFPESSDINTITVENSTCYKGCLRYEYDTGLFESTIVSEWDLICERRWLASFTQMMLQLGILIGSIVFGFMSDRFGRKLTFLFSVTALIVFGFGIPFSPNYITFTVLRFLLGFATAGTMVVSFVIVMETTGPRYREALGCLFQIPFIVGHMTVPLFAYFYRKWDTYSLALAVPPLIYLGYFFLLTESPRWLVSVGRVDEATDIVTRAALMNKLPTEKIKESLTSISDAILSKSDEPRPNYLQLMHRSLRVKTLCCCSIWLITGVTFFGLNQYISQTSPDPFISVFAAGAIQDPGRMWFIYLSFNTGCIIIHLLLYYGAVNLPVLIPSIIGSIWLIRYFGRKITTILFSCLGGLCIILLGCLPNTFALQLTFGTLGVSFASVVATTIYIYTSELYPTVVRNMGMGAVSTGMRIGSMLAPFISNLATTIPWLPTVVFGLAPIAAGALCLLLPETKGRNLPDSLEDVQSGE